MNVPAKEFNIPQEDFLPYRDEWISDVLSDLELSPIARLVGAYLGLAVNIESWPCTEPAASRPRTIASRLGLPPPIAAKACNALMRRGWLYPSFRDGRLRCFNLSGGPS
jgi:hypothetical protein